MGSLSDALRALPGQVIDFFENGGAIGEWLNADAPAPIGADTASGSTNLESISPWTSLRDSGHHIGTGVGQFKEGLANQFGAENQNQWAEGMQGMLAGLGNTAIGGSELFGPVGKTVAGTAATALPALYAMNRMAGNEVSDLAKMHPGQTGAVRGGKTPRMLKEVAENLGYWHPIGNDKKLNKPVSEMTRTVIDEGTLQPEKRLDLESMQGGVIIPGTGDRTDTGKLLTHVGDKELDSPVRLEGGPHYTRGSDESAWASGKGVVSSINKKSSKILDEGKDPYLMYMPMGHGATDFNTMMSDSILEQIRGNVSNTAKLDFDKKLRKIRPEWKGIDNPESLDQLNNVGDLRRAFTNVASLKHFDSRGFPDIEETRFALTDPSLLDTPSLHGGQVVSRLTGETIATPKSMHTTYPEQLGGEYIGGISEGAPLEVMFPDFYKARREINAPINRDHRSFDLSKPVQETHQEWLDGVMRYLDL